MELFAPRHLLVILLIVMVIFGTKKLRTIGSDLGGAIRGFKQAMKEGAAEDHESHDVGTQPALPNTAPDTTGTGEAATKSQSQSTADANR